MDEERPVAAVILAAGESRRYGSPKQLAVVDGRTLLEHAIDAAASAGASPVIAVVPVWLTRPERLDDEWLRWIRNRFPEQGMSLSLRLGFEAIGDDASAALILLGDQPRVPPDTIAAVLAARGERPLVAPVADGIPAPPILVERSHFHLVEQLTGDIGLRQILLANPELVRLVPVAAHAQDVDTPEDLARLGRP